MCAVNFTALPSTFYEPSAAIVAPRLLGHWLVRRTPQGLAGGVIVETEAYLENDPACHAFAGRTKRNGAMWGRPGLSYVYLIYGFHHCFNTVCRPEGVAEAVLVRAIEPVWGLESMKAARKAQKDTALTSGPGKLCAALGIDRELDGADLTDAGAPLFVAENPDREAFLKASGPVVTTTRIGISKAADWALRFYAGGSRHVSKKVAKR